MENTALVTIIIPVFNVAPYLIEAVESAIDQTYEHLEIILVDDGSTDDSGKICDTYAEKDDRVRVIHQENKGLSAARNAGLDVMTGDMVAFLDSDDAYCPDYVRKMLDAMTRESADIVVCRFTIHYTTGPMRKDGLEKEYPPVKAGIYDRAGALRVLAESEINPGVWNKLYRAELWKDIRFPVGHVYENIDTCFRIFDLSEKTVVLDDPLLLYRKRPGSITAVVSWKSIDDWLLARSHFESYIKRNIPGIFTEEELKRFYRSMMNQTMIFYSDLIRGKEAGKGKVIEKLRNQLVEKGPIAGIEKNKRYWMICHCPRLLTALYPVQYRLHQLKRVFAEIMR